MSLEKLLIFGFALAVVSAVTVLATSIGETRSTERDGYKEKVSDLVELTR